MRASTGLRRTFATVAGLSTVAAGVILPVAAAHAAEDVITVTTNERCNPDGSAIAGSLQAALEAANASTNADGVRIVFAEGLEEISFNSSVCKMYSGAIGQPGGNHQPPAVLGARYLIDSDVPVSIDFTNLPAVTTTTDADFAGFYVRSDDVVLENLANLKAGSSGIVIEGTDVTVSNITFSDTGSSVMETGVALLDGATNVTIEASVFQSQYWSSILIDGSTNPANTTTVTNIVIDNVTSRGVEAIAHLDIEDNAVVNGLTVRNSTFGATDETSTSHAVFINPNTTISDLVYTGNTVLRGAGAEKNVFYFEGSGAGVTFNDTVIDGNTFTGVSRSQPLSRIIGDNLSTWNNLEYTSNEAMYTRGIRMSGTINGALLDGNTFTETREPSDAGITLGRDVKDVTVSNNLLDTVWAVDGIRIDGTSATNVVIEDNQIHDFYADISRSALALVAPGTGNVVRNNEFVQHLERGNGTDLPTHMANHWAIYVWAEASAATANDVVGWSILNNHIDGFGGNPAISTQAPITNNARGKTLITGNTFGPNTRGSFEPETENLGYWFVWNDRADANNRVQTYRAEAVRFDGTTGSFTAAKPANEALNNDATAPVTLHVYWTADDNAEEYLGAIADVTPGQRVSIPTTHTTGYLRVQTVDANGNTSQYSSIDQDVTVAPAAPVVTEVTDEAATGTGEPEATVEIRDSEEETVATAPVAEDGTWTVDGLTCDTDYTAVQIVDGVESDGTEFTTDACPVAPAAPVVTEVTEDAAKGTGEPEAAIEVRDADGNVVGTTTVAEDGTWTVDGLECGVTYTVVQIVGEVESDVAEFTTAACATATPTATPTPTATASASASPSVSPTGNGTLPSTGAPGVGGLVASAALLVLLGMGSLLAVRRRQQA